ncbi:Peptidylprolyl isomerase [Pleodorina starrii]|uniref:peptidylprolyl isomerase n=1 Tax=Pleodorina starrii TaxID=330485 RepID=A0A9W6BB55_9CHLO|nr:Peptidylprolyl isomerase [Pleodorina starrii]GLC48503.1 Peptidylprolyl isomerase [Pleodorina starrii]GLC71822.1 Peptidylprolyl isomerase [Pleodorina starrii]
MADHDDDTVGPPRPPEGAEEEQGDGQEQDVGPAPPKPKKRKILEFEQQYLDALPSAAMYERSYMHRDTVNNVAVTSTDFIITTSIDGYLKFWKKQARGIEFVKQYRAHVGAVDGLAVSWDGTLCVTLSRDRTVKIFDVLNFDLIVMLRLSFTPGCAAWIYKKGEAKARVAISDLNSGSIHIFDARSGSEESEAVVEVHRAPVTCMRYNAPADTIVSSDTKGMLEYWCGTSYGHPDGGRVAWGSKLDTDLFDLAKAKATAMSLEVSRDGQQFAMVCSDKRVRVFKFSTAKLRRVYDESPDAANEVQRSGGEMFQLEDIDFGRRMAVERELTASAEETHGSPNALFDESGNLLLYATLLGIKVVNLVTNKVVRMLGKVENTERFLTLALYQGAPRGKGGAGGGSRLRGLPTAEQVDKLLGGSDPLVVACAFRKQRFYLFSQHEPTEPEDPTQPGRDIFNEKPALDELIAAEGGAPVPAHSLPHGARLHTTRGDITVKLFPDECPRSIENFTTHARNGYYDGVLFHRVIKGFMIQTGDPLGDGTGGESIWGGEFEDEFHKALRHDRPGILSMANAGPNTNGSQFFITTVPTPWLDNKHTVFGRVVRGMDVVTAIERVRCNKDDKPFEDIKILNITVMETLEEGTGGA